jgi:hypothetical protein
MTSNKHVIYPKTLTYRELPSNEQQEVWYETVLDLHQIHAMARRAAASKGQKSVDGPVTVRILELRKVSR